VIIFLNSNVCFTDNIALLGLTSDVASQLAFLNTTLLAAETADNKVWIVGNINPGSAKCNQ
jgi:hypothetical protein